MTLKNILRWYSKNKRPFPWRTTCDPYRIWVSEVMLQQTQAPRVIAFYEKFLLEFPNVRTLARASWPQVLGEVRGLGYYRRFRNMITAAKIVVRQFDGKFPASYAELRTLPGVGDYTANALLAFAFNKDVPVIDTNVRRVMQHFYGTRSPSQRAERYYKKLVMKLCPKGRAKDFFQAMMDYAARHPEPHGILRSLKLPQDDTTGTIKVAAAIIHLNKKILIQQRKKGTHLAGYWEFPGGKIEPGEDARTCLKREIQEELGIEVSVRPPFFKTLHTYPKRRVALSFHRCQILLGKPKSCEGQKIRWVNAQDLRRIKLAPADKPVAERLTPPVK